MGQSGLQLAELALAFVLSASIGLEREIRQKSAGLRTYTLVGFSSALVMLVSKYGFTNILESGRVVLDPSRIAAQIVSGIGFRRRPHFRSQGYRSGPHHGGDGLADRRGRHGLRSRTSDLGYRGDFWPFRCGLRVSLYRAPAAKIPLGPVVAANFLSGRPWRPREVLASCTRSEFAVSGVQVEREPSHGVGSARVARQETLSAENVLGGDWAPPPKGIVTLRVEVRGARSVARLAERLSEIDGVTSVHAGDANLTSD
jgi:putative Mg2+ transporter-C (MgtC) family protein